MGVEFLHRPDDGEFAFAWITPGDVAFSGLGVTVKDFERCAQSGASSWTRPADRCSNV